MFDIRQFWRDILRIDVILKNASKYPTLGGVFDSSFFESTFQTPPYYYHPLAHWLFYAVDSSTYQSSLSILEAQMSAFIKTDGTSFPNRISKMKSDGSHTSFYSFLSELALAWHYHKYTQYNVVFWEGDSQAKEPDLHVTDHAKNTIAYIESYANYKYFLRIETLREILREIDTNIKVHKPLFLKFSFPELDADEINHIVRTVIQAMSDKNQDIEERYETILFQEGELQIYYENDANFNGGRNYEVGYIDHSTGDPEKTLQVFVDEVLKDKASYGQLEHKRPNILAANFLFNTDFQVARSMRPLTELNYQNKPEYIDKIYLYSLGIIDELDDLSNYGEMV